MTRRRFYSSVCTGGAVLVAAISADLATGGAVFAAPASAGLATGSGVVLAASGVPALACAAATRARERELECPIPQECAIAGPAVNPISAPATAPTGPRTTAPDTAPNAALPARSWAFASNEKNEPAITAATSSLFIAVPLAMRPQRHGTPKMRRHEGADFIIHQGPNT